MTDPVFTNIPPSRNANDNNGKVIQDLEQRMPARHPYRASDRITWAHETTHGLQANIRNANFEPGGRRKNAFYHLKGRAIMCIEPRFRMGDYTDSIPNGVRGQIYKQYMVSQRKWWDDVPLYPWDEWTAYTNGTAARIELGLSDGWSEVQFMLEMLTYSAHALIHIGQDDSEENVQRERAFAWMADRSFRLFETMQPGLENARLYWVAVVTMAPKVVELLERLGVLYPRVMGGAKVEQDLTVLPISKPAHLCSQPSRDENRGVSH